jgi:hypothetical protein
MPAPETVQQIWLTTLVAFAVVLAIVALLLALILTTARRIRESVAAIWTAGQKIANSTIHIALLDTTHHLVAQIADAATGVVGATAALTAHAERCPGCPQCAQGEGAR